MGRWHLSHRTHAGGVALSAVIRIHTGCFTHYGVSRRHSRMTFIWERDGSRRHRQWLGEVVSTDLRHEKPDVFFWLQNYRLDCPQNLNSFITNLTTEQRAPWLNALLSSTTVREQRPRPTNCRSVHFINSVLVMFMFTTVWLVLCHVLMQDLLGRWNGCKHLQFITDK